MMKSIEIKRDYEAPASEVLELTVSSVIVASTLTTGEDGNDGGEW